MKCVLKSTIVNFLDVNEYGFCYATTACNRIKNYGVDTRMACSVNCEEPLTPGNVWPNYLMKNVSGPPGLNDITYTRAECQATKFSCPSPSIWRT